MDNTKCMPGTPECEKCKFRSQGCIVYRASEKTYQTKRKDDMFWDLLQEQHDQTG